MKSSFKRINKGFTLVELMIVLAVISILVIVLAPKATIFKKSARSAGINANMTYVGALTEKVIVDYDKSHRYSNPTNVSQLKNLKFLDGALEALLEGTVAELDAPKGAGFKNPVSGKKLILHWKNIPSGDEWSNPAVFITGESKYKYESILTQASGDINRLKGTVIVFLAQNSEEVQLFYIDEDGQRLPAKCKIVQ